VSAARPFGAIDRKGSGRWRVRYRVDGRVVNGGTYETKRDARAALAAAQTDLNRGQWSDPRLGARTFVEAFEALLDHRQSLGKVRPATVEGYRSIARTHLGIDGGCVTGWGRRKLATISRADVNALTHKAVT